MALLDIVFSVGDRQDMDSQLPAVTPGALTDIVTQRSRLQQLIAASAPGALKDVETWLRNSGMDMYITPPITGGFTYARYPLGLGFH